MATSQEPLLFPGTTNAGLTDLVLRPVVSGFPGFRALLLVSGAGTVLLGTLLLYTLTTGVGVWGNNIPVAWAFGIINFVWWIGIGHAGTFISAVLLVMGQGWRSSINRFAEAMTLFAVINAGIFPLMHMGRPWFFYWLVPYPSTMGVWPQFRSSLPWDVAAVTSYFTVSLVFWYVGLLPDLAAVRDHTPGLWRRRIYGVFALGWRGSARHWAHYRVVYGTMAGLATALVVSVHSIVSMDFAIADLPGWHSTLFPPFFVAGAIYSGFAMVLLLVIPARHVFRVTQVVTARHLDLLAKLMFVSGWVVTGSYALEIFTGWYSGRATEQYVYLVDRLAGPYAWLFWTMIFLNCVLPQLLWSHWARAREAVLMVVSAGIAVGMWLERFVLIVTSLHRDFLPSSWALYRPTWVDGGILLGTLCFFSFLFLLFLRVVPFIPLSEVKELRHELHGG